METRGKFKNVTNEELIELYINQNMSAMELADYYGVTEGALRSCLSRRGIHKSKEQIAAKSKELLMKKYGVTSTLQLAEVQDKIKKTCLERYGNESVCAVGGTIARERLKENPFSEEKKKAIRAKIEKTTMERYGVKHAAQSPEIQAKVRQQWQEKYSVDNPMQLAEFKQRMQDSVREKYGVDNVMQKKEFVHKVCVNRHHGYPFELLNDRELMVSFIESLPQRVTMFELAEIIGEVDYVTLQTKLKMWGLSHHPKIEFGPNRSRFETQLIDLIKEWGLVVQCHRRDIIPPYEIDIWVPEANLGIEVNGNYWHSELRAAASYHQTKAALAEEKGIRLCQFFEYELRNSDMLKKITLFLKDLCNVGVQTIYARDCEVHQVSSKEKKEFLETYHLQGNGGSSLALGLYYRHELVALMAFGHPRFNKKVDWELVRFCNKAGYRVVGGASKLFKTFLHSEEVKEGQVILSYSDYTKTQGKVYETLGFQLERIAKPNYVWCKNQIIKTRYQCQMKNENQIMHEQGYYKIFDAGNKVWYYKV